MTTYGTMQTRIGSETSAASLTSEIKNAIQTAIAYYETSRFDFNQALVAFATAARTAYGVSDNASIPNIKKIVAGKIGGSGWSSDMSPVPYQSLFSSIDVSSSTVPSWYAYHDAQLHLAPKPTAGYTATFACVVTLGALSDDADTNAWMTDGEELIRTAAKARLFRDTLRQYDDANRMDAQEYKIYRRMLRNRSQLLDFGPLRADDLARQIGRGTDYDVYGDQHY